MEKVLNIPAHLPKRLTIGFPNFGTFDTGSGVYHDLDKIVKEYKERGFNCIRLETGAGLAHDLNGNPRGPIFLHEPFGKYSKVRHLGCFGGEGYCDFRERLLSLCKACKKHGVYLILSSWYFLHTYWFVDNKINDEIFSVKTEDMFMTFARLLHYLIKDIKENGYADCIAMAEIFNEVGSVPLFIGELKNENVKHIDFKKKHEEALAWLQETHPDIIFGFDNDCVTDEAIADIPENLQAYNGHNYFLWGVYGGTLELGEPVRVDISLDKYTDEDIMAERNGLVPLSPTCAPWYSRIRRCYNLDESKFDELKEHLNKRIKENREEYLKNLDNFCEGFKKIMEKFPGIPVVCGEGVTYCASLNLTWEEENEDYWEIIKIMMQKYKELGLWGTIIKTNCAPDDPSWYLCKDKVKELNEMFLE